MYVFVSLAKVSFIDEVCPTALGEGQAEGELKAGELPLQVQQLVLLQNSPDLTEHF
jgi:hypothetical protein